MAEPADARWLLDPAHCLRAPLAGVWHAAGVLADGLLARQTAATLRHVYGPKAHAAWSVQRGCAMVPLHSFALFSSVAALLGSAGQANYAASKAGLIGMSKSLAQEVASRSITVNCLAPGFIITPMTDELSHGQKDKLMEGIPSGRLGEIEDVAAGVVYLSSEEASYVTGQTLHINGGMAMF